MRALRQTVKPKYDLRSLDLDDFPVNVSLGQNRIHNLRTFIIIRPLMDGSSRAENQTGLSDPYDQRQPEPPFDIISRLSFVWNLTI